MASDNHDVRMTAIRQRAQDELGLGPSSARTPGEWGGAFKSFDEGPSLQAPLGGEELTQRAWQEGRLPGLDPDVWKANWRESVQEPAEDWWEKPRTDKFMDVLSAATDVFQPGKAAGTAGVFMLPNIARKAAQASKGGASKKAALESAPLRKVAADWLKSAHNTVYKKGTKLGDLMRSLAYKPKAASSFGLEQHPNVPLSGSSALGSYISLGGHKLAKKDPAVAMHVLGHEVAHPFQRRLKNEAATERLFLGPEGGNAQEVLDTLEEAVVAGKGFRRSTGVMGPTVSAADSARSIPETQRLGVTSQLDAPHPARLRRPTGDLMEVGGPILEERMEKRMGERVADLLSELTTFKGQQSLNEKQRGILARIMSLY